MSKAIKSAVPVDQAAAQPTICSIYKEILPALRLGPMEGCVIGSAGKKLANECSQDIDFALDRGAISRANNAPDPFDFVLSYLRTISPEVKDLRSLGLISCAYPISGSDARCQLDLMLVDNLKMASFFYWSPGSLMSKYKGAHRTIFLTTVTSLIKMLPIEYWNGVPVTWRRYFLEPGGLFYGTQTVKSPKDGRPTTVRRTLAKKLVSTDPAEIIHTILGHSAGLHHTASFEGVYSAIWDAGFPYPNDRHKILNRTKHNMREAHLPIPKELESYR